MSAPLPSHARAVVVGGGIAGCSTAYHLTKLGWRDVVVLEQGKLTCGTTWHAAGLVGQLRATRNATRMSRYGIELYSTLEKETGLATGWKQCGSLNVAKTPERLALFRRQMARAKSFGIEFEFISPEEAGRRAPILRTDDLSGAVWIPGDGKANPTDLTQSLARGARMGGARIVEGARVTGVRTKDGRVRGVDVLVDGETHAIDCDVVVNCAGQWARAFGAMAGVDVPLYAAEHFYIVTEPIPACRRHAGHARSRRLHLLQGGSRRPGDGRIRAGREAMARRPDPRRLRVPAAGRGLGPVRAADAGRDPPHALPRDRAGQDAAERPESFTGDGNFILGEAPSLGGYFVCAGFNSAGIANSGGAGKLVAQWIVDGEAPLDLWDVDIRRFAPFHAEQSPSRGPHGRVARPALRDALAARGA
jgi:4-methylaminobutanoate oxidase (formaldehyde-forming)